jgi:hypothetical protein
LASRHQPEWTLGKPLISRGGGIEKEKKNCDCRQSHPDDCGNRSLSGFVYCDRDVMEIRHARLAIS